jgi:hypothetical protein
MAAMTTRNEALNINSWDAGNLIRVPYGTLSVALGGLAVWALCLMAMI